jgi:serine/threonine protein kinase
MMIEEKNVLTYVADENGQKHQLTELIGQGGQGAVYKTSDPNIIVKMKIDSVTGEFIFDEAEYEKYKAGLDEVRTLDLPDNLHIAKVASVLQKPYCGYTMRMLGNMKSVKYWIRSFGEATVPPKFFRDTGGLRYRLKFLANAAGIFAKLNYRSVVYADLSPDNMFVSTDNSTGEVWLIDADNMRYFFDVNKQVTTPGYGAPEIIAGGINTLESDEYTFAILAHEILTLNSPFNGEMLAESGDGWDEDAWDASVENGSDHNDEDTYIPWIFDPYDDRNSVEAGMGLSPDLVMTNKMKELFYRNFSKEGQTNPKSRPTMREWFEELRRAQNLLISCEHCKNTYFMKSEKKEECPFCKKQRERDVFYAQILDEYNLDSIVDAENQLVDSFNKEGDFNVSKIVKEDLKPLKQIGKKIFDDASGTYGLFNYQTDDLSTFVEEEPTIAIKIDRGKYTVVNCMTDKKLLLTLPSKSYVEIAPGSGEKFDDLNGMIITLPVTYGRKEKDIDEIRVVDDISIIRKRHIKFIRL